MGILLATTDPCRSPFPWMNSSRKHDSFTPRVIAMSAAYLLYAIFPSDNVFVRQRLDSFFIDEKPHTSAIYWYVFLQRLGRFRWPIAQTEIIYRSRDKKSRQQETGRKTEPEHSGRGSERKTNECHAYRQKYKKMNKRRGRKKYNGIKEERKYCCCLIGI